MSKNIDHEKPAGNRIDLPLTKSQLKKLRDARPSEPFYLIAEPRLGSHLICCVFYSVRAGKVISASVMKANKLEAK